MVAGSGFKFQPNLKFVVTYTVYMYIYTYVNIKILIIKLCTCTFMSNYCFKILQNQTQNQNKVVETESEYGVETEVNTLNKALIGVTLAQALKQQTAFPAPL